MFYIVATPIGNLAELTHRAEEVLRRVSVIYCEDTRHSRILLQHYGITAKLISYQKFNERARADELTARLLAGEDVALISDAGMPLISDPGGQLVAHLADQGLPYTVISGPCAAVNAAVLSGLLTTGAFCFVGFLPEKQSDRQRLLLAYADTPCPLIFYIARHDVEKDIAAIAAVYPDRRAALVREISKAFEEVVRFTLGEPFSVTVKGEFALVVEGAGMAAPTELTDLEPEAHLRFYLDSGMDKTDAIKRTARERSVPKSEIYKLAVEMVDRE